MSRLIITFAPKEGEGPIGYFRRLATENSYPGWRAMVRACGLNPTLNSLWKNQSALASALGIESEWIRKLMPIKEERIGLHDHSFSRAHSDPVCPQCLKEAEYIRHNWSHCFVTACPIHLCQLVDTCPSCSTALVNSRQGIATCDCGYDLRCTDSLSAKPISCWVSSRISGDMQIFTGIEEIGQPHDYIHLSKLLFQLSIRFDPSRKGRPGKLMLPKNISQSIEFLDPVLHLFEDLRPRWTAHIARRFSQGNLRAYSLGGRLGAWYGALHTLCCKHDAFPIMWEIFSDTAFEYFDGVLRGQNQLKPSSGKVRMYLGLQEAARYIGMSVPLLLRAIELKQIDARISREGVNYRIKMFSRIEADRVRVRRMAWLTESQVAEQLSVADSIVRNLVRAEVLSYDRKWFVNVEKAGPIDSASVNTLAERISTFLVSREVQESLTMNELTARRTVDIKALITLYKAIFNGDVRPVAYDAAQGLAGFVFDAAEVKKYLGSVSLSNGLTITQVEVATGWKYECMSNWITLNLLEGEHITLQGRSSRIVTAGALASFRRKWIPISDIAASVGSKSSAITKLLRARGIVIHGQTNSANGSMRGGLLSIRDLVGIAGLSPTNRNRDKVS